MANELKIEFTAKKAAFVERGGVSLGGLRSALSGAKKSASVDRDGEQFEALIRLQAAADGAHVRMPLSLVVVIDRSGSMSHGRLDAAKRCTIDLVKQLQAGDEVGVVIYDTQIDTLLPLTPAMSAQALIEPLMDSFDKRGGTDLHGGWLAGAALLAPRTGANRVCRVMLLSDGHANHGLCDVAKITGQVEKLAQAGVTTTTVGIGLGFNEELMSEMATAGRGSALFGERPEDLVEPFEVELGLLTNLVVRDVTMYITSNVHGTAWRVHNAYPRDAKNGWRLPSVAVGSEAWAAVSMPMEKLAQARRSNAEIALRIEYTFTDSDGESRQRTAAWDLSAMPLLNDAAYDALPAEELVVRRFSELQVADILQKARAAVIERDWKTVEALLAEVRKQSQSNAWLEAVVTQLEKMLKERDGARMAKEMHFGAARMHNRLAFSRELDDIDLAKAPLHLRRRDLQGRRDEK